MCIWKNGKCRGIARIFRRRYVLAAFILLAVMVYAQRRIVTDPQLNLKRRILSCESLLEVSQLPDGTTLLNDDAARILAVTPDGRLRFHIDAGAGRQITGLTADSQGNLYFYLTTSGKDGIAQSDEIRMYGSDGQFVKTLYTIDYAAESSGLQHTVRTSPLSVEKGRLYFTRYLVYDTVIYELSTDTGKTKVLTHLRSDIPFLYADAAGGSDGSYTYAKITGETGTGIIGGEQTITARCSYWAASGEGIIPFYVRSADHELYVFDYWEGKIYKENGGSLKELELAGGGVSNTEISEMSVTDGRLYGICANVPWVLDKGRAAVLPSEARVSFGAVTAEGALRLLKSFSAAAAVILSAYILAAAVWMIVVQGHRAASKLMLFQIVVIAGILFIAYLALKNEYSHYIAQNSDYLQTKAELTAKLLSKDDLSGIGTSWNFESETYGLISRELIDSYGLYESASDTAALLILPGGTGDSYCIVASNRGYGDIFGNASNAGPVISSSAAPSGSAYIRDGSMILAYCAVTDAAGKTAGYLCLSTQVMSVKAQFFALWQPVVLAGYLALMLAFFALATYLFTRRLKRVSAAIREISAGNFSVRVPEGTQDEIGALIRCVNELSENIEGLINDKTRLAKEVSDGQKQVLGTLASIVENKSGQTGAHVARVSQCVRLLASHMGYEGRELEYITTASMLHDVGKLFVPPDILEKPGRLTPEEFEVIKRHTTDGLMLLQHAQGPIMEYARRIAAEHHEKWDGTGYMLGLAGEQIHLEARITAVADVFDALISKRPYKKPLPPETVYEMIVADSGKHFDPAVVKVFAGHFSELCEIIDANPDRTAAA